MTGHNSSAMQSAHIRVAKELGGESLVARCYAENGTEYKKAIHDSLVFTKAFTVTVIDDGKRQYVLDLAFDQVVRQTMVAGIVITVVGVTIGIGGGSIDGDRRGAMANTDPRSGPAIDGARGPCCLETERAKQNVDRNRNQEGGVMVVLVVAVMVMVFVVALSA